jgi:hypothetical protein
VVETDASSTTKDSKTSEWFVINQMTITATTLFFFFYVSSYSQALQSVVNLGFQYHVPLFPAASGHLLSMFNPSIFKSS